MKTNTPATRTLRIALPAGILLGGLALASLFPRDDDRDSQRESPHSPIVYRRAPLAANPEGPPDRPIPPVETVLKANPFAANRQATVLQPVEQEPPLPRLTRTFPRDAMGVSPRWGISMGMGLNHEDPGGQRIHRIVDGDTLPDLAERYLGDKSRALEIFEANRHILPSPEILPIGHEIMIPGAVRPASVTTESALPEGRTDARLHTQPSAGGRAASEFGSFGNRSAAEGLQHPRPVAPTAAP